MFYFWLNTYWLLTLKAIFRSLYFWQLKEYRLDRFKEVLTEQKFTQFILPTRYFLRPKFTLKALLITLITFFINFSLLSFTNKTFFAIPIYFLIPLTTTLIVLIFKPITWLGYQFIISTATLKLRWFYKNLKVIGITGSYGKTSTKEILAHLLSSKYKVVKTHGTNNTAIGVAKTILKTLKPSHQVFVAEMGAYTKGEIKQIAKIIKPQIGIITGITSQHLKLFGSMDNLLKAKLELLQSLPKNGLVVFNGESPELLKASKSISLKTIIYTQPKRKLNTNLVGQFQQLNLQGAILVAKSLGVKQTNINKKILSIPQFQTMIKVKTGLNKAKFYLDIYNSNPVGFSQAIKLVDKLKSNHKVLVSSGISELGSISKSVHQKLAKEASLVFDEIILTNQIQAKYFKSKASQTVFIKNHQEIHNHLKKILTSNSIVLIEGRLPLKFTKGLC